MFENEKPVSEEPQDIIIDASETGLAEDEAAPRDEAAAPEVIEEVQSAPVLSPAGESIWKKLFRQVLGIPDAEAVQQRVNELNRAIVDDPESPVNYVLRGEAYLEAGEYTLAFADFQRGVEMAGTQVEQNDWGIVAQAVQDRALQGLKRAEKRLSN